MNYEEGSATWSLGVLIWLPVLILCVAALIAGGVLLRRYWLSHPRDPETKWLARFLFASAVLLVIGIAAGYYPWKAEYHQYVTKTGTIETISSRLLGSSDSFQQKFVVRYTDGREFGCEDTRCSLLKPGDALVLACKRTWQYAGVDGYDCKYIESRPRNDR